MNTNSDIIDLFLCHNGADKPWVEKLAAQFESETIDGSPSGRRLKVFFDKWDIDIGQNVVQRINECLARARYVAVIISPEFLAAPWPSFEWTHVVADDPTNRKGRLIPLFVRATSLDGAKHADLPAPFKALNWIDFRAQKNFKRSYQRLIHKVRDLPPPRGPSRRPLAGVPQTPTPVVPSIPDSPAAPDPVSEAILGNLLPVASFPTRIWSAPTDARKSEDVYTKVPDSVAFILREKRLYTFADLNRKNEPLRKVITTTDIKPDAVTRWRDDEAKWRWFIALLHQCLRKHTGRLPIRKDAKGRFFFRPNKDGTKRVWTNRNDPPREVAAEKPNTTTGEVFWVHHSAWLKFQTLGETLFLSIDPSYVFTSDGTIPLEGPSVGPLTIAWAGKERNAAILRHVLFWARTLGRGNPKIEIETGAAPVVISGIPAIARTKFGIEFDHIAVGTLMAQIDDELGQVAAAITLTSANVDDDDEEHGGTHGNEEAA